MTTPVTAPVSTRTSTRTSARRQELITIAADLFAEQGFAKVTVDDIGRAAGVSGPALYHHFDGKEAMLGEMLVGISQYLLDGGRRTVEHVTVERVPVERVRAGGDESLLRQLIEFHAEFAVDHRSLITVHFRDLLHAPAADRSRVRALQNEYVDLWTVALRQRFPELPRARALAAVHATFGLINSTPHSARVPRAAMVRLLADMATSALLLTFRP